MADDSKITEWLQALKTGDAASAQQLWDNYFQKLVRLAAQRLPAHAQRVADEEDVALSAFKSFCLGVERGRFPQLNDREDLWHLLVTITARKSNAEIRRQTRQKRGGGAVEGESAFMGSGDTAEDPGIGQVPGVEPTPLFAAEVAEEFEHLLTLLGDETLKSIALLKMEGYTREEIAAKLGRSIRSIARRLDLIRKIWDERA